MLEETSSIALWFLFFVFKLFFLKSFFTNIDIDTHNTEDKVWTTLVVRFAVIPFFPE